MESLGFGVSRSGIFTSVRYRPVESLSTAVMELAQLNRPIRSGVCSDADVTRVRPVSGMLTIFPQGPGMNSFPVGVLKLF